ncbi:MAG: DUF2304 domain-containing protein [Proteobacteria bacterium]|nr:DUF2304 domain-containing protein [Pseudomonadota bacterium]
MIEIGSLQDLRELFLSAPESQATRVLAILASLGLAATVLWLVRRRSLREEYTPIWMAVAAGLMLVSFNLDIMRAMARVLGAWSAASTIFFMGEVFLLVICLNFAVRLSRASGQLRLLGQEVALLRERLDRVADTPAGGVAPE